MHEKSVQQQFDYIMGAIHDNVENPLHPAVGSILSKDDVKRKVQSYANALDDYVRHMDEDDQSIGNDAIYDFCTKSDALMSNANVAYHNLQEVVKKAIGMQ